MVPVLNRPVLVPTQRGGEHLAARPAAALNEAESPERIRRPQGRSVSRLMYTAVILHVAGARPLCSETPVVIGRTSGPCPLFQPSKPR